MFTVDLSNEDNIKKTARLVLNTIGPVSVLVMAAAPAAKPKLVLDLNYKDDIEMHFKVSYLSQLFLIQEFLKPMIYKNSGNLATISSSSAHMDMPLISTYACFKSAQSKLMETTREELIASNVNGVKTTVVYLSIVKGGIANDFKDVYGLDEKYNLSGEEAAKRIATGILKGKSVLFIPGYIRYLSCLKYLFTPRAVGYVMSKIANINPKYLISSSKEKAN